MYELLSSRAVLSALCSLLNAALLMRPSQLLRNSQAVLTLLPIFKDEKNRKGSDCYIHKGTENNQERRHAKFFTCQSMYWSLLYKVMSPS